MTISYECPKCGEWIEILPTTDKDAFECPWCKEPLRLDEDADFNNGSWHDRSKLRSTRPHIEKMVEHAAAVEECEHKYTEIETAPLGVRCIRCGHFVGAHET